MGKNFLDIMQNIKKPNTVRSIVDSLHKLGIMNGDILLVHSSLSSMGWVIGGDEAVVWALLQAVGETGTLVMPSYTMGNSDPTEYENPPIPVEYHKLLRREMLPYNPHTTSTCGMGVIAEKFRTFPNTLRSNHPQTSFCANGKYAHEITKEHIFTPQWGMNSPLGKLYGLKAKILLLGVGYNVCTCLHMSETLSGIVPSIEKNAAVVINNGEREWICFNDIDWETDDFIKIGKAFEKNHTDNVKRGKIGNAKCKLFELTAMVNFGIEWIKSNRKY